MALRSLVGGAIFAEVSGSGWPLVVALHGWRRDRGDMAAATAGLPGTVALLDLPGHGSSPEPPEPWGSEDYAHRVGLAIDELLADLAEQTEQEPHPGGPQPSPPTSTTTSTATPDPTSDAEGSGAPDAVERGAATDPTDAAPGPPSAAGPTPWHPTGFGLRRAVVVGHSTGGRVGVCLAAQRPELVAGLVLAGVPLLRRPPGKPKPAFRVMRRLHRWRLVSDGRMEAWRQRYGSADYVAAQGVMRQVLVRLVGESYEEQLARLECPVAMVWGELDTAAPLDMARRAAALVPTRHTFDVAEGVGHDVHTERPDLLQARIVELSDADTDTA